MADEVIETSETTGLSRRKMIKRVGAGAALVWAAPAVLSIQGGVAAASPAAVACADCGGDVCFSQGICSGTCPCSPLLDGTCRCWGPAHGFCDDFPRCDPAGPNNGDGDCPAGTSCVPTCCYQGGQTGVCVAPCGAGGARVNNSGNGPRTDGGS